MSTISAPILRRGKNKASKYKYDGISFDSQEEIDFYLFLKDALKHKLIKSYEYQPKAFELIPKVVEKIKIPYKRKGGYKIVEKTILQPHIYTADWLFFITPKFNKLFPRHKLKVGKGGSVYVDIKGSHNKYGGDRVFPINQKLLYMTHGIYVNKVVPIEFFKSIRCAPDELRWMKKRKIKTLRKHYRGISSFEEILLNNKNNKQQIEGEEQEINVPFLK